MTVIQLTNLEQDARDFLFCFYGHCQRRFKNTYLAVSGGLFNGAPVTFVKFSLTIDEFLTKLATDLRLIAAGYIIVPRMF
jgi:hypothetical protein